MKKLFVVSLALMLMGMVSAQVVGAADYTCPAPTQVNCVPATTTIGSWTHNGGQMTGNTFAPNNQCANVIPLPGGKTRLLCCYTKCGVFTMDVPQQRRNHSENVTNFGVSMESKKNISHFLFSLCFVEVLILNMHNSYLSHNMSIFLAFSSFKAQSQGASYIRH